MQHIRLKRKIFSDFLLISIILVRVKIIQTDFRQIFLRLERIAFSFILQKYRSLALQGQTCTAKSIWENMTPKCLETLYAS